MIRRQSFFGFIACIVALNYFAFRTELFQDEYKENHPARSNAFSIQQLSLNWETFDKDNAPQAFSFAIATTVTVFGEITPRSSLNKIAFISYRLIKDKSPPAPASLIG